MVMIRIRAMPPTTEPAMIPAVLSAKRQMFNETRLKKTFPRRLFSIFRALLPDRDFLIQMYVSALNLVHFVTAALVLFEGFHPLNNRTLIETVSCLMSHQIVR